MTGSGRPVGRRGRGVGPVFVGGTLGTAARLGLSRLVPPVAAVPVVTLGINVLGAFLLGLLLERLSRSGPDEGWRRDLRLGVGTGLLGGFTTYSALAVDSATLLAAHSLLPALGYAVGTLVLGLLAAAVGLRCGARAGGVR